jgi:hypothetical protein
MIWQRFDRLAGLSEMERKRSAAEIAAREAAQKHYDTTGEVPDGFKMVYGRVVRKEFEVPALAPAPEPAKPWWETRPITADDLKHPVRRKEFFKNLGYGAITGEHITPELLDSLDPADRARIEKKLKSATKAESFDVLAGLVEDHDPADGAKLRDLVGKISMSVAAHESAKDMAECSKHVAAIKAALDEVNPILDRL